MAADNHNAIITAGQDITVIVENEFNKSEEDIIKDYTKKYKFQDLVRE